MKIITSIRNFIINLDQKKFLRFLGAVLLVFLFIVSLLLFRYYRSVNTLIKKIDLINEQRERAQVILKQAERVNRQRAEVDAIIAEDEGFKIGGYFNSVLAKLRIAEKKSLEETKQEELEGKYRETQLDVTLVDMNMKEVSELLNELDQNKRIYTKKLELTSVRKGAAPTLEVKLTIATLEPKTVPRE